MELFVLLSTGIKNLAILKNRCQGLTERPFSVSALTICAPGRLLQPLLCRMEVETFRQTRVLDWMNNSIHMPWTKWMTEALDWLNQPFSSRFDIVVWLRSKTENGQAVRRNNRKLKTLF